MGRFLFVFGVGIVCVLLAVIAIVGHWVIAAVALAVGAVVVLLWGVIRGVGGRRVARPTRWTRTSNEPRRPVLHAQQVAAAGRGSLDQAGFTGWRMTVLRRSGAVLLGSPR